MAGLPNGLLEAARNYLDITWEDPEGDEKLSGILLRGMRYLDGIAGAQQDYTQEDKPRELLLDYARYARDNALDRFERNYRHELIALQIARRVERYGQSADV